MVKFYLIQGQIKYMVKFYTKIEWVMWNKLIFTTIVIMCHWYVFTIYCVYYLLDWFYW